MNIAKSSAQLTISRFLVAILGFLATAYYARLLGARILGIYFLFQASLGVLNVIANFGLSGATEKRVSEGTDQENFFVAALLLKLIPIGIISILIAVFQGALNDYIGARLSLLLIPVLFFQQYSKVLISTLRADKQVARTAWVKLFRKFVQVGTALLLVFIGAGVYGLISGLAFGHLIAITLSLSFLSLGISVPAKEHFKRLFDFSKYGALLGVGGLVYNWADTLILGIFLTQSNVGVYESAWRVTVFILIMSNALATSLFPKFSEWSANDQNETIEKALSKGLFYSSLIPLPAFFGGLLLSKNIMTTVFGAEFSGGWIVLIILLAEKIPQSFQKIIGRALLGIDKPNLAFKASFVGIVFNLGLNFILIPIYGLIGAALATVVSSTVSGLFLHGWYLSKHVNFRFPIKNILWSIGASLIMFVLLLISDAVLAYTGMVRLILSIGIGVVVYTSIMVLNAELRDELILYFKG